LEKTEEYLAVEKTPEFMLCDVAQTAHRLLIWTFLGRVHGAVDRYIVTRKVIQDLDLFLNKQHFKMPDNAVEAKPYSDLMSALHDYVAGLKQKTHGLENYEEFFIAGRFVKKIANILARQDCIGYMPPNGKVFKNTRKRAFQAQGIELPAP